MSQYFFDTGKPYPDLVNEWDSVHELIELRKLRKQRQGIDSSRLSVGDAKRRRNKQREEGGEPEEQAVQPGLRPGAQTEVNESIDECVYIYLAMYWG